MPKEEPMKRALYMRGSICIRNYTENTLHMVHPRFSRKCGFGLAEVETRRNLDSCMFSVLCFVVCVEVAGVLDYK